MMYHLEPIRIGLRFLALGLLYCTCRVIYLRINATKYSQFPEWSRYLLKKHMQYVIAGVSIVVLIVAIVEGIIAPHLGRHYFPFLDIHLFFCAIMVASGFLALIFSGKMRFRGRLILARPIFGRLTVTATILVSITGFALTYYIK